MSEKMQWTKLKETELPKGEVLCANFSAGTGGYKEKLVGYVSKQYDGKIICSGDNAVLENVTHYIDINKFDISYEELK